MSMYYATEFDERDLHTLPTIEIAEFTAREVAEARVFHMESADDEDEATKGGFMWCVCLPGCLPDSDWIGPFPTHDEALADARATLAND